MYIADSIAAGVLSLMLFGAGGALAADRGVNVKYMGETSCGAWRHDLRHDDIRKAAVLNWVLGFLSGRAMDSGRDVLAMTDQASISAWLDNYCRANPLESVVTASFELERELDRRLTAAQGRR